MFGSPSDLINELGQKYGVPFYYFLGLFVLCAICPPASPLVLVGGLAVGAVACTLYVTIIVPIIILSYITQIVANGACLTVQMIKNGTNRTIRITCEVAEKFRHMGKDIQHAAWSSSGLWRQSINEDGILTCEIDLSDGDWNNLPDKFRKKLETCEEITFTPEMLQTLKNAKETHDVLWSIWFFQFNESIIGDSLRIRQWYHLMYPGSKWELASKCAICNVKFGWIWNTRHHCRICNRSLCSKCACYSTSTKRRVCSQCVDVKEPPKITISQMISDSLKFDNERLTLITSDSPTPPSLFNTDIFANKKEEKEKEEKEEKDKEKEKEEKEKEKELSPIIREGKPLTSYLQKLPKNVMEQVTCCVLAHSLNSISEFSDFVK